MLKRSLIGILRSHELTGEKAKDPLLKSRFFRLSKEQAWEEVISVLKKLKGYKIVHEVSSVGEILLEKRTFTGRTIDITVTLVAVSPVKTAVDIYSASRGSLGDLGANYRIILDIFRAIDHKLKVYKVSS